MTEPAIIPIWGVVFVCVVAILLAGGLIRLATLYARQARQNASCHRRIDSLRDRISDVDVELKRIERNVESTDEDIDRGFERLNAWRASHESRDRRTRATIDKVDQSLAAAIRTISEHDSAIRDVRTIVAVIRKLQITPGAQLSSILATFHSTEEQETT